MASRSPPAWVRPRNRNLSSADPAIRKAGRAFFEETLTNLAKLDIRVIGGALHSYWPIDYSKPVDKAGDRARGLEGVSSLADFAADLGVDLCLEVLNRFENHVLNTAEEGVAFVREIGKPNVKVMLDTFHMNIEEDSFGEAIRAAGPLLGHFHTGENNRRVPGKGRLPWHEIGAALREIGYCGAVVMEPFVKMGGQVGNDIRVWRDLSGNANEAQMDEAARQALAFSRYVLGFSARQQAVEHKERRHGAAEFGDYARARTRWPMNALNTPCHRKRPGSDSGIVRTSHSPLDPECCSNSDGSMLQSDPAGGRARRSTGLERRLPCKETGGQLLGPDAVPARQGGSGGSCREFRRPVRIRVRANAGRRALGPSDQALDDFRRSARDRAPQSARLALMTR